MQQPVQATVNANGVNLAVYHWNLHNAANLPTLVLTHATGFHARCWNQVIARLGDYPVLAIDLRGHGESEACRFQSWGDFTDDLSGVLLQLGVENALAAGHSMGAYCTLDAALRYPQLFSRLLLIDPVIMSPEQYQQWDPAVLEGDSPHFTARRRADFKSVSEMKAQYGPRAPYSNFDPAVFADYCDFGLRSSPGKKGLELACSPPFEGRIYDCALANAEILEKVKNIEVPVTVVRAMQAPAGFTGFDFRYSPTWPQLAEQFAQGKDLFLENETHFLPLESPGLTAELIRQQLLQPADPMTV